jgi:valyl-tRNA synthetase
LFTNVQNFENEALLKNWQTFKIFISQRKQISRFTFLVGSTEVSIPLSENLDLGEEKRKPKKN